MTKIKCDHRMNTMDYALASAFQEDKVTCPECLRPITKPSVKSKLLKCIRCKQRKSSVERIACGYVSDIEGRIEMENICPPCEKEHLDDI